MKYSNVLTIRPIDRSLAESYGVAYYRQLSDALIERAAAQLKRLNEVVKPQEERVSIRLVLHALLMASNSIQGKEEESTNTVFVVEDDLAAYEPLKPSDQ